MLPTLLNIITEVHFTSFELKEFFVIEGMSILPFIQANKCFSLLLISVYPDTKEIWWPSATTQSASLCGRSWIVASKARSRFSGLTSRL